MPHLADGVSRRIIDDYLWDQINFAAQVQQTAVKLVILVTHQICVEWSCLLKHLTLIAAKGHCVGFHNL